ncbi:hypothetical protein [Bradyrhizobium sp. B117]|uniref:hypothetical protein n=1 Tax=Bradyrhizobium sp. B117 TaxID=3140246 RepID=UPI00318383C7
MLQAVADSAIGDTGSHVMRAPSAHRRREDGITAIIRFNNRDAITLFAPPCDVEGTWREFNGASDIRTHSRARIIQALGSRASSPRGERHCADCESVD